MGFDVKEKVGQPCVGVKTEGNEISEEKQAAREGIMSFREEQKATERKEGHGIEICRIGEETRCRGKRNWGSPGISE